MRKLLLYIGTLCLLTTSCQNQDVVTDAKETIPFDVSINISTDIEPFVSEDGKAETRVSIAGNSFESGDLIRLRIIAPFVTSSEYGERTWESSFDDLYLLTWNTSNWSQLISTSSRGFDINGDFTNSNSPVPNRLVQSTPYVFTATTWTEEIHYIIPAGKEAGTVITTFSNIFKADQRHADDFKASDVLWAQQFMQTGTDQVRLSFQHKMALLSIDISEFGSLLGDGTEEVVLTVEGLPDIDQQEVAIGNYYAEKIKNTSAITTMYGDKSRNACSCEENGQVLGIAVIDEITTKGIKVIPFAEIAKTGVYTAFKYADTTFRLIIPPYDANGTTPTVWLRKGEKRWSAPLCLPDYGEGNTENGIFKSGVHYKTKITAPSSQNS